MHASLDHMMCGARFGIEPPNALVQIGPDFGPPSCEPFEGLPCRPAIVISARLAMSFMFYEEAVSGLWA
jgi:hypothetical protein